MSDLPEPRRRRVAPAVPDPMAPAASRPEPAAATPPGTAPSSSGTPANPATTTTTPRTVTAVPSRRQEPTVQLGTRVRPESDRRLRELAATRGTTIRQVIEDLVDDAWRTEIADRPTRF